MKFDFSLKPMTVVAASVILIITLHFLTRFDTIEGLSNPAHTEFVSKGLKTDITTLEDSLLISKYNTNYKEILNDMMDWCDLEILKVLVSNKINIVEGVSTANTELIASLNQYSNFKTTLQGVYDNVLLKVSSSNT